MRCAVGRDARDFNVRVVSSQPEDQGRATLPHREQARCARSKRHDAAGGGFVSFARLHGCLQAEGVGGPERAQDAAVRVLGYERALVEPDGEVPVVESQAGEIAAAVDRGLRPEIVDFVVSVGVLPEEDQTIAVCGRRRRGYLRRPDAGDDHRACRHSASDHWAPSPSVEHSLLVLPALAVLVPW